MRKSDVLIIGSGIAGLSLAIKLAQSNPKLIVQVITKADEDESNTKYAQGGIAVVHNTLVDSFEKHIQDTLKAGDGYCDEEVVRFVINEGPDRLAELIEFGTKFDKNQDGEYSLGMEGGHSEFRVLHHKDITGAEIERALLAKFHSLPNTNMEEDHFAVDLITEHHIPSLKSDPENVTCFGAYALNKKSGKIDTFQSGITVMASGGAGQVYQSTTNPKVATGDGIAMAYRAKARIADMAFVQFHPTALYEPGKSPAFLISEAVRGFGAKLKDKDGNSFMKKYDPREELASRDIVAKAIDNELKTNGDDYVLLDCTHLDQKEFLSHFPNIYEKCKSMGISLEKDLIPVVPAAHYTCGGIEVDHDGKSTIQNLYSCGEASRTGLHGANRLASNSLLEALVFAHRICLDINENYSKSNQIDVPDWNSEGTILPKEKILISQSIRDLQSVMSNYMAIVRSNERMTRASRRIALLWSETKDLFDRSKISPQICELRNLVTIAYLIVEQSKKQKENKGAFYNVDLDE